MAVSYTHLDVYKRQSYHKLPNPLSDVIQRLPVVDGLDPEALLKFLRIFFQLADFPGLSERTLLELIYPYCRGSMAERVTSTLRDGGGIDHFHREVLDAFVPGRLHDRLRHKHFYRVQASGESLAHFISSVKDAARILRLGLSESDVIHTILEGVTPEERSRLTFAVRPQSFIDLDRLCAESTTIRGNDDIRAHEARRRSDRPNLDRRVGQPGAWGPRPAPVQSCEVRELFCSRCHRSGHVARYCNDAKQRQGTSRKGNFSKNVNSRGR